MARSHFGRAKNAVTTETCAHGFCSCRGILEFMIYALRPSAWRGPMASRGAAADSIAVGGNCCLQCLDSRLRPDGRIIWKILRGITRRPYRPLQPMIATAV